MADKLFAELDENVNKVTKKKNMQDWQDQKYFGKELFKEIFRISIKL